LSTYLEPCIDYFCLIYFNHMNNTEKKRVPELDLAKSFTIIVAMIGIHSLYHLADYEMTTMGNILNVLATAWGAPVFMFCMGVTLGYSHKQKPTDWMRRGCYLITIGMALNVLRYGPAAFRAAVNHDPEVLKELAQIFNVDILQFAGLSFLLLSLCKYLRMNVWKILLLSLALNVVGTLLDGCFTAHYVVNQILGYFYPTPTCCCFPLFNWFIFVAVGNAVGHLYRNTNDLGRFYRFAIPTCGIIALFHQYFSFTQQIPCFRTLQNDWGCYSMHTIDALCISLGVIPFELGVFRLISKIIPDSWMKTIRYPSVHINQFYCVSWVWICCIADFFLFVPKATTDAEFIIVWIALILLTTLSVVLYNQKLKERLTAPFSHHSTAWTIAIWAFILLFAIWYFNTIPEPYTMPY